MIPAPKPTTAAVEKEPLISPANCAELDITLSPVVLKTVASTAKLLFEAIVPPPDNPSPAVNVILEWSTCSFATKFAKLSWSIVPCVAVPTNPTKFVA